jgi:hypothetical protein
LNLVHQTTGSHFEISTAALPMDEMDESQDQQSQLELKSALDRLSKLHDRLCAQELTSDVAARLIHKFEQVHDPGAPLLACAVCGEVSFDASDFLKKMVPLHNVHVSKVLMLSQEQRLLHDRQESQYKGLLTVLSLLPDIRNRFEKMSCLLWRKLWWRQIDVCLR